MERDVALRAEEHNRRLEERQVTETELRDAQRQLDAPAGRIHEIDIRETEGRVRREELLQEAGRRHAVSGAEGLLAAYDPTRDLEATRPSRLELAQKLDGMSPHNVVAD